MALSIRADGGEKPALLRYLPLESTDTYWSSMAEWAICSSSSAFCAAISALGLPALFLLPRHTFLRTGRI